MSGLTFIAEDTKTTVLVPPATTGAAKQAYLVPTAGTMGINLRAVATMGNAADMTLTLKSADNATGTNAVDFATDVPLFVGGVRQANANSFIVTNDTGSEIVDFCVDPGLIPDGKFVGIHVALSNVANLVCTTAIEDSTDKPSV